jgi:AcrR family transcriptional regulator
MSPARSVPNDDARAMNRRVLHAAKCCCERWGISKVTVDDIANEAGISRATLYRLFPGGKDVLFEALRVQDTEDFFGRLGAHLGHAEDLEDLLVRALVHAMADLRTDEHLAIMLAASPGETAGELTIAGVPQIISVAMVFLTPLLAPYVADPDEAAATVELLVRLAISVFLAPSEALDLGQESIARNFVRHFVLPSISSLTSTR